MLSETLGQHSCKATAGWSQVEAALFTGDTLTKDDSGLPPRGGPAGGEEAVPALGDGRRGRSYSSTLCSPPGFGKVPFLLSPIQPQQLEHSALKFARVLINPYSPTPNCFHSIYIRCQAPEHV